MSLFSELKRRNVIRAALLYGVASWVLLQVGDLLFGVLGVPPWGIRLLLGLLLLGFPLVLIFAWVYELTPEGLKRERDLAPDASVTAHTARKLDLIVIVLLVSAVCLVVVDRFLNHRGNANPAATSTVTAPLSAGAQAAAAAVSIAELAARRAVTLAPDRTTVHVQLGSTLLLQKRPEEALVEFDMEAVNWSRMTGRALVFAVTGKQDLARAELDAMQQKIGDAAAYQYAEINAQLGDPDEAFRWLERAREIRSKTSITRDSRFSTPFASAWSARWSNRAGRKPSSVEAFGWGNA